MYFRILNKIAIVSASMLLGILLALIVVVYQVVCLPVASDTDVINIKKSMTAYSLSNLLESKKIIKNSDVLLLMIRLNGFSQKLKTGIYKVNKNETAWNLIKKIINGNVLTQKVRIAEGFNQWQIDEQLSKIPYLDINHKDINEGSLLADTYTINAGSSSEALLIRAAENLTTHLHEIWECRDANLPYKNSYELLTAASIIEKESSIYNERRLISGIIVNRLQKNMPLQMDPTVIYALGANHKGLLKHNDLKIDSPYNSYIKRGLPPTPIAMVSLDSLQAAAHPLMSHFLYFVAKGDGTHKFSVTYREQRQAIALARGRA